VRHLGAARLTPGGPEIHQHHLALVRREHFLIACFVQRHQRLFGMHANRQNGGGKKNPQVQGHRFTRLMEQPKALVSVGSGLPLPSMASRARRSPCLLMRSAF